MPLFYNFKVFFILLGLVKNIEKGHVKHNSKLTEEKSKIYFKHALNYWNNNNEEKALDYILKFVRKSQGIVDNYGWGQFILARILENKKLYYASSMYYMLVAKSRTDPDLIQKSLISLHEIKKNSYIDNDFFIKFLSEEDFGVIDNPSYSIVEYYRGYSDLISGNKIWAEKHFENISKESQFYLMYKYLMLVYDIKNHKDASSIHGLEAMYEDKSISMSFKKDIHLSLARMYFEMGNYDKAIHFYEQLKNTTLHYKNPDVFLEKAWSYYFSGNYPKALGNIYTLESPYYEKYIIPEIYWIKSLSLMSLCHFYSAKIEISKFKKKFYRLMETIKNRSVHAEVPEIKNFLLYNYDVNKSIYLENIKKEKKHIEEKIKDLDSHKYVYKYLLKLYKEAEHQVLANYKVEQEQRINIFLNRFLEIDKRLDLLDYTIDVKLYEKTLNVQQLRENNKQKMLSGNHYNYYLDDEEYWYDELDNYYSSLVDNCEKKEN